MRGESNESAGVFRKISIHKSIGRVIVCYTRGYDISIVEKYSILFLFNATPPSSNPSSPTTCHRDISHRIVTSSPLNWARGYIYPPLYFNRQGSGAPSIFRARASDKRSARRDARDHPRDTLVRGIYEWVYILRVYIHGRST